MAEKDGTARQEENVLIRAGSCSVTILPRLGGKIASIRVNDRELLQAPLAPCGPRTRTMSFDAGDASGWDECLPSVADCTVETAAGQASVPDHGDLWRVEWKVLDLQENVPKFPVQLVGYPSEDFPHLSDLPAREKDGLQSSITLRGQCFSLPLALERTLTLIETGKGWKLNLDYTLTNTGDYPVPWSWAAHPLFVAEAGDRIVLPDSIRELLLEGSGGSRLGKNGDRVAWPLATLTNGGQTDLSLAQSPESGIGDKLFAGPLSASENWCALERPQAGVRIKVSFDPAATPYLGLWICYGGWPDRPGPKQVCVALEPATAPVDSLAKTGPWSRALSPGESFSWPMIVEFESI